MEFALVLPLLLVLLFGIIDFGRMLNAQITLTEAAREGARASMLGADPGARVTVLTEDFDGVTVLTTPCPANPTAADNATVTVSHEFQFLTPIGVLSPIFGADSFGGPVTLSSTGVMPCRA